MAQLEYAISKHQQALEPMLPDMADKITEALAVLRVLTCSRPGSQDDAKLQCFAYQRKLAAYPARASLAILEEWPSRSKFFPTWFELQDAIEKRMYSIKSRLKAMRDVLEDWQSAKKENSNAD